MKIEYIIMTLKVLLLQILSSKVDELVVYIPVKFRKRTSLLLSPSHCCGCCCIATRERDRERERFVECVANSRKKWCWVPFARTCNSFFSARGESPTRSLGGETFGCEWPRIMHHTYIPTRRIQSYYYHSILS